MRSESTHISASTAVKNTTTVTDVEISSEEPSTENDRSDSPTKLTIRECPAALDNETSDDCKLRLRRIVEKQRQCYRSYGIILNDSIAKLT